MTTLSILRDSWQHLYKHLWYYLQWATLLYLILAYGAKGLLSYTFNRILAFSGIAGLSYEDLPTLGKHPLALIFLFLYLMLLSLVIIGEFYLWIISIRHQVSPQPYQAYLKAWPKKLKQLFGPQALLVLAYIILMIPLGNFGLTSTLFESLKIPDFIPAELSKSLMGRLSYWGAMGGLGYLNLRLIFFLPLLVSSWLSPLQALKKSWKLTQRYFWPLVLVLALYSLVSIVILTSVTSGAIVLFSWMDPSKSHLILETLFLSIMRGLGFILNILFKLGIITAILQLMGLTLNKRPSEQALPKSPRQPRWRLVRSGLVLIVLISWVATNALALVTLPVKQTPLMIAHRGNTAHAVENSIAAMSAAHKAGADYSEMDVVMTKDKQFVVFHDKTLKRLAGLDKKISDMTLQEVTSIPINQHGQTSHIASLSDFMTAAKEQHQKILIELKPYDTDISTYLKHFIKQGKDENLFKDNQIMSTNRTIVEGLKERVPEATVGYIIPLQLGGIPDYQVDFYAIENFSVNDLTLLSAAQQKKPVYTWTINQTDQLQKSLDSPVQGIVTDELKLFKEEAEAIQEEDSYLDRAIRILNTSQTD